MSSNSMRNFAFGMIVATTLCGAVYYLSPSKAASNQNVQNTSNQTVEKTTPVTQTNTPKEEIKEKPVYRTVLSVTSGMTSYEVGKALEQAKVINMGALAFSKEVEKRGLANKLHLGTYSLDSGMTVDKIITTVFH